MKLDDEVTVYVLFGEKDACKGVYLSENDLKEGVDYWIRLNPKETLSYQEWEANYPAEPNSWDWAYINPDSLPHTLASGGNSVPQRMYWGKNLIGVIWKSIPEWEEAYK